LPLAAAEMVLIRVAYAADLPTPAELISEIKAGAPSGPGAKAAPAETRPSSSSPPSPTRAPPPSMGTPAGSAQPAQTVLAEDIKATAAVAPEPVSAAPPESTGTPIESFHAAVELAAERREMKLYAHLMKDVHLVHFEPGRIEIRLGKGAPTRLPNQLGEFLTKAAEMRWVVSVSDNEGEPTLQAQADARAAGLRQEAAEHPLVREILDTFPGAKIRAVRDFGPEGPDGEEIPLRENGGPDE